MNKQQDTVRKNTIELLDCQCDIVLKSLEYYCYSVNFLYDRKKKYTSGEEELKISLVTDTYHQIQNQIGKTKYKGIVMKLDEIKKIS